MHIITNKITTYDKFFSPSLSSAVMNQPNINWNKNSNLWMNESKTNYKYRYNKKTETIITNETIIPFFCNSIFYPNSEIENIKKEQLLLSINKIVNKLINDDNIFNDINKFELLDSIENLLDNSLINELSFLSQNKLTKRIKKIMMWESLSGMLNDLTEEQQKTFDEATKRRPLFR